MHNFLVLLLHCKFCSISQGKKRLQQARASFVSSGGGRNAVRKERYAHFVAHGIPPKMAAQCSN